MSKSWRGNQVLEQDNGVEKNKPLRGILYSEYMHLVYLFFLNLILSEREINAQNEPHGICGKCKYTILH